MRAATLSETPRPASPLNDLIDNILAVEQLQLKASSGLSTVAESDATNADWLPVWERCLMRILRYRPTTLAEFEQHRDYMRDHILRGHVLTEEEIEAFFDAEHATAEVSSAGQVFNGGRNEPTR